MIYLQLNEICYIYRMEQMLVLFFLIVSIAGYSQRATPLDEQSPEMRWQQMPKFMDDVRALELRPASIGVSDSLGSAIVFQNRESAIEMFTQSMERKDYTIYYISNLKEIELYEERRKVLRKQFYHDTSLPKVESELIRIK